MQRTERCRCGRLAAVCSWAATGRLRSRDLGFTRSGGTARRPAPCPRLEPGQSSSVTHAPSPLGPQVLDEKETTVYKRALEVAYNLKIQASRAVFSLVSSSFSTMPFALRALLDEAAAKNSELKASIAGQGQPQLHSHDP